MLENLLRRFLKMERENILKDIDDLEYHHQEVKKKYLKWANGRLPNNGIGAKNNKDTRDFLKKNSTILKEFRKKGERMKNKTKIGIVWMSAGNSYFSEANIEKILRKASKKFSRLI